MRKSVSSADLIVGDSATTLGVESNQEPGVCSQEEVLNYTSVGGFWTYGGWNSIMESLSAGVQMLCWSYAGDQQTNCKYMCNEWECGLEIPNDVKLRREMIWRSLLDY